MSLPRRLALFAGLAVATLLVVVWLAKGSISVPGLKPEATAKEAANSFEQEMRQAWIEKTREAYAKAQEYLQRGELDKARIVAMRGVHYPYKKLVLATIEEEVEPPFSTDMEGAGNTEVLAYFPANEALRFFSDISGRQVLYFEPLPGQDRFGVKWAGVMEKCKPYLADSQDTLTKYFAAAGYTIIREVGQRPSISAPLTGYYDPPFSFDTLKVTIPADPKPTDAHEIWGDFFTPRATRIKNTYKHLPDGTIEPAF